MLYSSSRPKAVQQQHKSRSTQLWQLAVALLMAAALSGLWLAAKFSHRLPSSAHAGNSRAAVPAPLTSAAAWKPGRVHDVLLHQIIQECMQQQDTVIAFNPTSTQAVMAFHTDNAPERSAHVTPAAAAASAETGGCPVALVPLAAADRSIGLCTDAALYMQLLGAWIVPGEPAAPQSILQDSCNCLAGQQKQGEAGIREHMEPSQAVPGSAAERAARPAGAASTGATRTAAAAGAAVLFLEPLYDPWLQWLQAHPVVVAVYAPNFEQVFGYDKEAHLRMQLVLCKVHRCHELMQHYLKDIGSSAQLFNTAHTSLDPLPFSPHHQQRTAAPVAGQQQPHSSSSSSASDMPLAAAAEPLAVLHTRGKSSLKHTKQLLDCWLAHPEWPKLTVVGPLPNEQVSMQMTKQVQAASNIAVPRPGKAAGPGWPHFDPLPQADMSALLLSHALHIMPSEREGFGHSINEGRAAGAVLLVPDHPPMNELVQPGAGLLMQPAAVFSHSDDPVPALGRYGNISASMSPQGICGTVSRALLLSKPQRLAMGRKARQLFEEDRRDFEQRMAQLPALLHQLAGAAEAAYGVAL